MSAPVVAFVGLGANLGDAAETLRGALAALALMPCVTLVRASSLYRTPAWGIEQQPDFVNAAAMLETTLAPEALLEALLRLEREFGRDRNAASRWGPRTLDLDLLLYADLSMDSPRLTLPHPHMHERAFVLVPLLELDREVAMPGRGLARDAVLSVATSGIRPLPS